MEEWQSSRTVEEELQEKKDIAKEHLVTNNRNWGKMSPMMLAAKTHDRDIIAHDLCWKVICKVWRNGTLRQQADIFTDFYRYCCSQLCICTVSLALRRKWCGETKHIGFYILCHIRGNGLHYIHIRVISQPTVVI